MAAEPGVDDRPAPAPGSAPVGPSGLVVARDLVKRYGDFTAVAGIDVTVHAGEAFGFLGPNGAGKSSTMRMVAAVSPPTSGTLSILGMDPATQGPAIRARLGVVPQEDTLDLELSVSDNLIVYARYFDIPRKLARRKAEELLAFVHLEQWGGATVDTLSGGMKRRLTIARALVNDPELILLDEPTTGLDPQARHAVWDRLYRLKADGVTLVLTTHYMDEAEQLCDRLVVMDAGRIAAEGSPLELIERFVTREVLELRFPVGVAETVVERAAGLGQRLEALPDRLLIYTDDGEEAARGAASLGLTPVASLVRRASLEDVFLRLAGRTLAD